MCMKITIYGCESFKKLHWVRSFLNTFDRKYTMIDQKIYLFSCPELKKEKAQMSKNYG